MKILNSLLLLGIGAAIGFATAAAWLSHPVLPLNIRVPETWRMSADPRGLDALGRLQTLEVQGQGRVEVSSKVVSIDVYARTPGPAGRAPDLEAHFTVEGPWDKPRLSLKSLKKKKFKAVFGL